MRTIVYIDAANIILSAQNLNISIDIFKLIQYLKDVYRTETLIYFTGDFKSKRGEFSKIKTMGVDFVHLYDFARSKGVNVKVIAFDPKSCSRMTKRRVFTRVSYLVELGDKVLKKNPQ